MTSKSNTLFNNSWARAKRFTLIFHAILFVCFSCQSPSTETTAEPEQEATPATDNAELQAMYEADQNDRRANDIDWDIVVENDIAREERVYEMLDSNMVQTANDYHNAAMIFQHGMDSVASGMAVKMMAKSLELNPDGNKWLYAAAVDRDLMRRNEPQIYGTQYQKMGEDEPWKRYKIDTTVVTDQERIEHGVETLAEQREKERRMNLKQLYEMHLDGKSITEIVAYCISTEPVLSEYDISENGLNNFGYELMAEGKMEEALEIFKTNTLQHPEGFNTWDSYGECLLEMGQTEASIEAYEKSLELNPSNTNAENVLKRIKTEA